MRAMLGINMWWRSIIFLAVLTGCNAEIYLRDGVTDGDTFSLAPVATVDSDPVLQSWVAYSLSRSVCQLDLGDDNPARATAFHCEVRARTALINAWTRHQAQTRSLEDDYLDTITAVRDAGLLREYTAFYFGKRHWQIPADLDAAAFDTWRQGHLVGHTPETRIIGSWSWQRSASASVGRVTS